MWSRKASLRTGHLSRDLPEKGESPADLYLGEGFPDSRDSKCKGPEAGGSWPVQGSARRPAWLGHSNLVEGGEGEEVREAMGQIPTGHRHRKVAGCD